MDVQRVQTIIPMVGLHKKHRSWIVFSHAYEIIKDDNAVTLHTRVFGYDILPEDTAKPYSQRYRTNSDNQ